LNGYLYNPHWVTQRCPYIVYTTSTILIWFPLVLIHFVTLSLKNNWVLKKN